MRSLWLIVFLGFLTSPIFSQFGSDFSLENFLKGKPGYILKEDLEINVYGVENSARAFRIRRDYKVKILNESGVKLCSEIRLPEAFDPTTIIHGPAVKKLGTYYSDYKVDKFEVHVKRGKKEFSAKVKKKQKEFESFNIDYLYDYQQDVYYIQDLIVGDEVRIVYDLEIPLYGNYTRFASYRLFFHDSLPKLEYKLTLSRHKSLDFQLYHHNQVKAKSMVERDKIVYYTYEYENLPGCIGEVGSRPYAELPHISWVLNIFQYLTHNSPSLINVPHYAVVADLRAPDLTNILTSVQIGSKSHQYQPFIAMYDSLITKGNDQIPIRQLHQSITEDFKYDNDLEFYRRDDTRGERLGDYFSNKVLRDNSRYNLYYALLINSKTQFFTSFVLDKRVGEISEKYFQPTFDNDFLLSTYYGEHLFDFIIPKSSQYGWYYNELPFYWENANVQLVHISDYAQYRYPIKEKVRSTTTHATDPADNLRSHAITAVIDLDFDSVSFDARIELSGQYSTLCRAAYKFGPKDKSVNIMYRKPLWWFQGKGEADLLETDIINTKPPFNAEVHCRYSTSGIVEENNGTVELHLSNWFPHISPDFHMNRARYLAYYPDFLGKDEFSYTIQFTRPLTLEKPGTIFDISNNFGSYLLSAEQEGPNAIKITSQQKVYGDFISTVDFQEVMDFYEAIKKANDLRIKLQ